MRLPALIPQSNSTYKWRLICIFTGSLSSFIASVGVHAGTQRGTSPSSSSLANDYSTSLIADQSSFSGSARLSVSAYDSETGFMLFSWNITGPAVSDAEGSTAIRLTPWLLFVEDSASFPEGSNGVGDYLHVLHDAVELDGPEGIGSAQVPAAWDGDDVPVLLLIDWTSATTECCGPNWPLPGPGLATVLLCFLAALLPSRRER